MSEGDWLERIGGRLTLIALAIIFYDKLEKDKRVNQFLYKIDLNRVDINKGSLCTKLLGLQHYFVKDGQIIHEDLVLTKLKQEHLEIMTQHLKESMECLNIDKGVIAEVCGKIG